MSRGSINSSKLKTFAASKGLPNARKRSSLSFHLKELAHADLVTARQEGRFIYYAANYAAMNNLMAYLTENCCQGQGCLVECKPTRQLQRKRA